MNQQLKKLAKLFLKIAFTLVALYWVFNKIDFKEVAGTILQANGAALFTALLFFSASKLMAAFRLNHYFKCIEINLPAIENLKLYWLGMFYNMFLPGGIGGDGYKIYLLNKEFGVRVRTIFHSILLDRLSGMSILVVLALGSASLVPQFSSFNYLFWIGIPLVILGFTFFNHWFFKTFKRTVFKSLQYSFLVQGLQLVAVYFIMKSLGVTSNYTSYFLLFLVSSIVSVLPISLGGVGAREFTFLMGAQYFNFLPGTAVAISLLFYLISLVSSLAGIFFSFNRSVEAKAVS